MIYEKHLLASEVNRLNLGDVDWDGIDVDLARSQPSLLDRLRDAAIIEAHHPVHVPRVLQAVWDDVEATAILSIELFEGFRHFHGLKTYLDRVGHLPVLSEQELVEVRRAALATPAEREDATSLLVDFMGSEHFAAYFFARVAEEAREPVLGGLLRAFSREEFRHAQGLADVLKRRVASDKTGQTAEAILQAAQHFHHYGAEAVALVPRASEYDLTAVMAFSERVEQVCGSRLVDHLKRSQFGGAE